MKPKSIMMKRSCEYAILQNYALTLKSQRVAKFIALASSALGTVFLGREPYGFPIKAWNQEIRAIYILKQNTNKRKG